MSSNSTRFFSDRPLTTYLISPQPWEGIKVSKHHYAAELAEMGHAVYFIEPPDVILPRGTIWIRDTDLKGVRRVTYAPWFPYRLKFHARPIFDAAMHRQAHLLTRAIGNRPDLVWDFDNAWQFRTLKPFGASRTILHLVDQFRPGAGDKDADLVVVLSESFCTGLTTDRRKTIIEGHCVSRSFAPLAQGVIDTPTVCRASGPVRVGYFGNLNHPAIDWETLYRIASTHPQIEFELVGPGLYEGPPKRTSTVIAARMRRLPNCHFPGLASPEALTEMAGRIDAWLLCYDRARDPNRCVNSHKILEYLATGSVCVSSRVEEYIGSNLIAMTGELTNGILPELFAEVVRNLEVWNAPDMRSARARYALSRTYRAALERVLHACAPAEGSGDKRSSVATAVSFDYGQ